MFLAQDTFDPAGPPACLYEQADEGRRHRMDDFSTY
jgi:hypothetical protein